MIGTIITPTHDRPEAFALCEEWMGRQTFPHHQFKWVVADDGVTPVVCTRGQHHVRSRSSTQGKASFLTNLRAAAKEIEGDLVLFIEDDDWYHSRYLELMVKWLEHMDMVGEGNARYYNVWTRRWKLCGNTAHASLAQTGLARTGISAFKDLINVAGNPFVDLALWKMIAGPKHVWRNSTLCVGIKGLPGTKGIGMGHQLQPTERHDPDLKLLKQWIGEDAERYRKHGP